MVIQQRFCVNHPQRPAIGLCVITGKAICGECSTRYEGVNYSREGLEILQKQRAAAEKKQRSGQSIAANAIIWIVSPLLIYLMYCGFLATADLLASLLHEGVF